MAAVQPAVRRKKAKAGEGLAVGVTVPGTAKPCNPQRSQRAHLVGDSHVVAIIQFSSNGCGCGGVVGGGAHVGGAASHTAQKGRR
jgi:hypothetical protein